MSLLFDEHPLVLSPTLAKVLGNLNEAVFLQQLHYWIEHKKQAGKDFIDGRYWVYNSVDEWLEQFPWLSSSSLRRVIDSLVKKGYVIKGNYNRSKMDHTAWYTIDYEKIMEINERSEAEKEEKAKIALETALKEEEQETPEALVPQATNRSAQNEQIELLKMTNRFTENDRSICSKWTNRSVENDKSICSKWTDRSAQNEQIDLLKMSKSTIDYTENTS